jgi:hypothetical protein
MRPSLPTIATLRTSWSLRRRTSKNGSNLSNLAWSSGEGLMSADVEEFGQYCPGISMDEEPPPYSPPTPSLAAALAAANAALSAAFRAIAADDKVVD